ncbi:MAG TPA: extracellular solute-binding protein, partial [Clostridiales bacterium]|nr:extracellular solute-binding protein [Clostridiales bacterium]
MSKRWMRFNALLITIVMVCAVFVSCSSNKDDTGNGSIEGNSTAATIAGDQTSQGKSSKYPDLKEHVHVDVWGSGEPGTVAAMEKYFSECLGRKFILKSVPNDTYNEKVNTMLLSGDYPDTIMLDRIPSQFVQYKQSGQIIPLTEYLNKSEKLKYLIEKQSKVLEDLTYSNEIWGIPYDKFSTKNFWIRQDWLDNLGLKRPETTDEFLDVLRKFKDKDPDMNQKDDTIPLVIAQYLNDFCGFFYAFGANYMFAQDSNGNAIDGFSQPQTKDALQYIKNLMDENFLEKEWITTSYSVLRQKTTAGKVGSSVYWGSRYQWFNVNTIPNVPEARWEMIPFLKGPNGDYGVFQDGVGSPYCITTGSKNPDQAFEFLEWLFGTKEGSWLFMFKETYVPAFYYEKPPEECVYDIKDGKIVPTQYTLNMKQQGIYLGSAYSPLLVFSEQFEPIFPDDPVDEWMKKWIEIQPTVDAAIIPIPKSLDMEDDWYASLYE